MNDLSDKGNNINNSNDLKLNAIENQISEIMKFLVSTKCKENEKANNTNDLYQHENSLNENLISNNSNKIINDEKKLLDVTKINIY